MRPPIDTSHRAPDPVAAADEITVARKRILDAAERKVRAQRLLGDLLAVAPLHTGGRPGSLRSLNRTGSLRLGELGLSKRQSADAQQLAQIADDLFENYLATTRAAGRPASAAGAMRAAREARELPASEVAPRVACTRATRRFSSHLSAARRLARDFGMDEQVAALAAAETLVRQLDVMFGPRRQSHPITDSSEEVPL
jgi:hypothetical protein